MSTHFENANKVEFVDTQKLAIFFREDDGCCSWSIVDDRQVSKIVALPQGANHPLSKEIAEDELLRKVHFKQITAKKQNKKSWSNKIVMQNLRKRSFSDSYIPLKSENFNVLLKGLMTTTKQ